MARDFSSLWRLLWIVTFVASIPPSKAYAQAPPATDSVSEGDDFSDQDGEEDPNAIRSGASRPSLLRKAVTEAGFSVQERAWIDDNCQFGMPKPAVGAALGQIRPIVRQDYVLGHSSESKIPYWVCEHAEKGELQGSANRDNSSFKPEPKLEGFSRAELRDYRGSGFDRGHMAPAGNQKQSQGAMDETFFLSNMVPQYGLTFNRGIWKNLEETVREWTHKRSDTWIISGPMFYDPLEEDATTADGIVPYFTIGEGEVAVPTHCFKIVLAKEGDGWRSIAFVFDNDRHVAPHRLELHRTTVDWIEERTGLDFFPDLSDDPASLQLEVDLESKKSAMWDAD